ncbi:MAG TPA: DHHA1 domain-containing protein [Caldilineaceae bacterium]|nr:DHHA1 domain-containing protein [Caldilineaceae bacterium]
MTERLYYTDSYQTEFDALLLDYVMLDGRPALVLERTCFYPTSGGQPNDLGTLGGQPVVDVVARDGLVYHVLAAPLDEATLAQLRAQATLHGEIAWPRRYDHMQQHSGQHLLSQVFARLFEAETVSVHFGADESTLDLDTAALEPAQLDEAERMANDLVYAALPIRAYLVDERELHRIPLRRAPAVTGQIRIVEIDRFDYSACGGTHVRTTAEIGPVKLVKQERRRGQTRVTFLCGKRAVADYVRKHRLLAQTAALFSTDVGQTPELVARLQEQVKELQRRVDELTTQQLAQTAQALLAAAQPVGDLRVAARVLDLPPDAVKTLANLLQAEGRTVALLGTAAGGKPTIIFARSEDGRLHMGNLLRAALAAFGGGGGGRPEFAQGGGVPAEKLAEVIAFAQEQARKELAR